MTDTSRCFQDALSFRFFSIIIWCFSNEHCRLHTAQLERAIMACRGLIFGSACYGCSTLRFALMRVRFFRELFFWLFARLQHDDTGYGISKLLSSLLISLIFVGDGMLLARHHFQLLLAGWLGIRGRMVSIASLRATCFTLTGEVSCRHGEILRLCLTTKRGRFIFRHAALFIYYSR